MAEAKTKRTTASPAKFLAKVGDEGRRKDCATLVRLMERITGDRAAMWGPSIVGFGTYHYLYASGTAGDWPVAAFSPRARNLTIYLTPGFQEAHPALMAKLGRHTSAKSCLYVRSLADVDLAVLERLIAASVGQVRKLHPPKAAKPAKRATAKNPARRAAARKAARKKATRKAARPARR
jgi:hypothetical protein